MSDRKNHQLYEELKKKFKQMDTNEVLVMTALGLERMWKPFVQGIEKTEYTIKEKLIFCKLKSYECIWYGNGSKVGR